MGLAPNNSSRRGTNFYEFQTKYDASDSDPVYPGNGLYMLGTGARADGELGRQDNAHRCGAFDLAGLPVPDSRTTDT